MTVPEKNITDHDPVKEQDDKNEDDEFQRIEHEQQWRQSEVVKALIQ